MIIRGREIVTSIVQGGMGIGVSGLELVTEVIRNGGLGTLSSAFMAKLCYLETGMKLKQREAVKYYVQKAKKESCGYVGINIMVSLSGFEETILGALEGGVDFIFMGAGISRNVPVLIGDRDVALVPIVSSVRALEIIYKSWAKYGRFPDAVDIEGPLAGGHLGFSPSDLLKKEHQLESVFFDVMEFIRKNSLVLPVIVAGGLFTHGDISSWSEKGASGFQFGTRFLGTYESGASPVTKEKLIRCLESDIVVAHNDFGLRQSPAMHPFRVLLNSPGLEIKSGDELERKKCKNCPILKDGKCASLEDPQKFFCIGRGLMAAIGKGEEEDSIITVGANAHRVKEIITVKELFRELSGG